MSTESHSPLPTPWQILFAASGGVGLVYEMVWMRRLSVLLGGSALASAFTIGAFMAGLAVGALAARWLRGPAHRTYAKLEVAAALWALTFPILHEPLAAWGVTTPGARWLVAAVLLIPPAAALGATWPVIVRSLTATAAARLYALNTTGAVVGVLGSTFLLLPNLGVRGTELAAASAGLGAAALALQLGPPGERRAMSIASSQATWPWLLAAAAAGFSALGLEVIWMRLAAVALGATVQTIGLVLATFLGTVALGAALGERWPAEPRMAVPWALGALGALALLGASGWGLLPYGVAQLYSAAGPSGPSWGAGALAVLLMGGAPIASGLAFSLLVRCLGPERAGGLYAANTVGSIAGAWLGGLWALPVLEARGAVLLFSLVAALSALPLAARPWPALPAVVLAVFLPAWDAQLFAVGVHLRISDFSDPSPRAIRQFADEGWTLLAYDHGPTGAVAVGRSNRTGNVWLSINGKVDASTGDDMPTQELSGVLPVRAAGGAERVLVVGLASGVTAGAVLAEPGVEELLLVELEPAVVAASRYFDHVNGRPLDDPRTTLVLDDARAVLQRPGPAWDVIVSEPSNPWITGVSSLFTLEYWQAARARLRPDGVLCQWVQLYGLGPEELRGVLRTFTHVFPDTWLFVTVDGSDVLLLGGATELPPNLPARPLLTPEQVRRFAGSGWLNTDDRPRVEWEAPRWLHYDTGASNHALLRAAAE